MEERESGYKIKPGAETCDSPLLICMPSRERDAIEYLRRSKRESTLTRAAAASVAAVVVHPPLFRRGFASVPVPCTQPNPSVLRLRE